MSPWNLANKIAFFSKTVTDQIQGVPRTTVQRLRVDAGPKGLPEKAIWTGPIFNQIQ
jgi:hypothetical protein